MLTNPRRVDLYTHSKALEACMLESFPGTLFPEQCGKSEEGIYWFKALEACQIQPFLRAQRKALREAEYELRDADTGAFIEAKVGAHVLRGDAFHQAQMLSLTGIGYN